MLSRDHVNGFKDEQKHSFKRVQSHMRECSLCWHCRLGDPSLSVSTGAADFDAQTRVISSPITDNRWSWTGDNSTWQGLSWSVSGSAVFNGALFPHFGYRVYFNEVRSHANFRVTL